MDDYYVENATHWQIWAAEDNWRVTMYSDGDKFVAQICAGDWDDNFYAVGYSSPNYAFDASSDRLPSDAISQIEAAVQEEWEKVEKFEDVESMLPSLFQLCKAANKKYNELLK